MPHPDQNHRTRNVNSLLTVLFIVLSVLWMFPIVLVLINSFKGSGAIALTPFDLPTEQTFVAMQNYITGMNNGNFPFYMSVLYSALITVLSVALILLCTSMAAWYINRVDTLWCRLIYYLCIFSMVVPFQMVMFTLSKTADNLGLNTPWTIPIIYLGFGAGLAVFLFSGFIKSIPQEIEEAANIDGCNPLQTFFLVDMPVMRSTYISVAILEIMWVWNDYLLPYLVLDRTRFMTIPIHIQFLQGSFGRVDYGATMAMIVMCLLPVVILYIACQKHIIKGVLSGAVKG